MIDRESAEKVLAHLDHIDPLVFREAFRRSLQRSYAEANPNENAGVLGSGASDADKVERFFDITIQVAPPCPRSYTAAEVAQFARANQKDRLKRASREKLDDFNVTQEDLEESVAFHRSIAGDYEAMALLAEAGDLKGSIERYQRMDTADRENFGWSTKGFSEARWCATLREAK